MGTPKNSNKTRVKLTAAAGELFADRGFNGVTVRDIVKKAETNLSALNYHFRTKEALYREVVLEACGATSISVDEQKMLLDLEPRKALFILVYESFKEYDKKKSSNWQTILINRECREPSPVFEEVIQVYFKPEIDFISQIVGKIVDQSPNAHPVRFAVISMISMIETFGLYGHLIDAVAPGLSGRLKKRELLAKQVVHLVIEAADPSFECSQKQLL